MTTIGVRPGRLDLALYGGQELDVNVPIVDANGQLVPGIGWAATAQVRASSDPAAAVLHDLTCSVADGTVRVQATPADTRGWADDWPALKVPWDLTVTDPDSTPHPLCAGWVNLARHITR